MFKSKVQVDRIMFPKGKEVEVGDFVIFTAKVVQAMEGGLPIINKRYGTISLKGSMPKIKKNDIITIKYGNAETNDYGTTYTVETVYREVDRNNKEEVENFIRTVCGNQIASELLKLENPYDILINKNDEELLKLKGVGEKTLEKIYAHIDSYGDYSYAYGKLEKLGLTKALIKKICMALGGPEVAVETCFNNAYSLIGKVKGIGFIVADSIALRCGLDPRSNERIKYAILHVLSENGMDGKSYLTAAQLMNELNRIVNVDMFFVSEILKELIEKEKITLFNSGQIVALNSYIELESNIAKEIERIRDAKSRIKIPNNWVDIVKELEGNQGWQHTEEQMDGIKKALENNIILISGKAGSGKSTITNAVTKILSNCVIEMCCLSAKAAQRLKEVTGLNAQTIHKLLGLGSVNKNDIKASLEYVDIFILDEASMVSASIFLELLKAIPNGSKLIILGDDGQLTAIGEGAVFSDLKNSYVIPKIELTKIHRQAEKSAIITQSINIRNQKPIYEKGFVGRRVLGELQDLEVVVEKENNNFMNIIKHKFMQELKIMNNDVMEVQIITAMKTRGEICTHKINIEIQKALGKNVGINFIGFNNIEIYEGDKVINLKNNYKSKSPSKEDRPIFNGNIGIVKKIKQDCVVIDFIGVGEVVIDKNSMRNINLAYAISVHSSQGSQWKRVLCAFTNSDYILLNVEILYTAITRAEAYCTLIIQADAMRTALRTVEQKNKQTLLPNYLK